jgi:O-antigen ligase
MGNKKNKNAAETGLGLVLLSATVITLYFNSKIQDPFNSPKLWLLFGLISVLTIPVLLSIKTIKSNRIYLQFSIILGLFLVALLLSVFATDNKYLALFGETQRRLGFLTYFCLVVLILYVMQKMNFKNIKLTPTVMSILGFFFAAYGQLQNAGEDFVSWNNPYNSIIGTLGNPNYAGAFMAIMAVGAFGLSLAKEISNTFRIFHFLNTLFIVYTIFLSNARQGLVSFLIGAGIISVLILYYKKKIYGLLSLTIYIFLGITAILGMLQIGPLTNLLYKNSVTIRGYYWDAGIEMFKDNPFFGVGIDSFGSYFKQYRDVNYPLKYGFDITSSNAHNVFIQFFATGGLFVGITYLLLIFLILRASVLTIKLAPVNQKPIVIAIFASWVSFQAQSIISIDNIGLTIWGWILGGVLIGLHKLSENQASNNTDHQKFSNSIGNLQLINIVVSTILVLTSVVVVSHLFKGEKNAFDARLVFESNLEDKEKQVYRVTSETFLIKLNDPTYKLASAYYMATSGFRDEGLSRIRSIVEVDPRNQDALNVLAMLTEEFGLNNEAVEHRISISKLDPWNAKNYLRLGNLYKFQGDYISMNKMKDKILSFAENTNEGTQAKLELVN